MKTVLPVDSSLAMQRKTKDSIDRKKNGKAKQSRHTGCKMSKIDTYSLATSTTEPYDLNKSNSGGGAIGHTWDFLSLSAYLDSILGVVEYDLPDSASKTKRIIENNNDAFEDVNSDAISFMSLPDDLICDIIGRLKANDIWSFACTCRRFRDIAGWVVRSWHLHKGSPSAYTICRVFPNLRELSSRGTVSDMDILESFGLIWQLKSLEVSYCYNITDIGLAGLVRSCPTLTHLSIIWCTGVTDTGMEALSTIRSLTSLSISDCYYITNQGLSHLARMDNLRSLEVVFCDHVTDDGLAHLCQIEGLQSLNVEGCDEITDEGLGHVKQLKSLKMLNISCCRQITDEAIEQLLAVNPNLTIINTRIWY